MNMELDKLNECKLCRSEEITPVDKEHNIFRCRRCGYVFDNPRPTADEIASFYSQPNRYDSWIKEERGRDILWQRRLKMVKKWREGGTLLDVGTGIGQFLFFAKNDFQVKGTEISESAIGIAKNKYDLDIVKGQIERINFEGLRFDIITVFHVLEHVPDPCSFMERCKELLSDEGVIVIAVPNDITSFRVWLRRLLTFLRIGRFKNYGKYGLPKVTLDGSSGEIHLSHFSPGTLKKWLERLDLIIVEDSLDPYYAAEGVNKFINDLSYLTFLALRKVFGINLYETIWIVAKRK